ncbi:MAG: hypothetical protein WBJ84_02345 [Bacteroidales bacterium]
MRAYRERYENQLNSISIYGEKYRVGEWYDFLVLKTFRMPGADEYFVLKSRNGNLFLLPAAYYKSYGLTPGTMIKCMVDKINCSGRVFLEPEHPYFIAGKEYVFRLTDKTQRIGSKFRVINQYRLKDERDNEVLAEYVSNFDLPLHSLIKAEVRRIRKGALILGNVRVINNC